MVMKKSVLDMTTVLCWCGPIVYDPCQNNQLKYRKKQIGSNIFTLWQARICRDRNFEHKTNIPAVSSKPRGFLKIINQF